MPYTIPELLKQSIWKHFYNISQIPHPSGKMDAISQYIVDFAAILGLETIQDKASNILVRKPAHPLSQQSTPVVLQSHLDMVPQKTPDSKHNFSTDSIVWELQDDWLTAFRTTLGADNGIGVAAMLSLLEDNNIIHPPLEALFTVDEENGMNGAFGLENDFLTSRYLINLDSEDDCEIIIGCAGAVRMECAFDNNLVSVAKNKKAFQLHIKGLQGGHSGIDIHLQRANANKLLLQLIKQLQQKINIQVASLKGGSIINAIPREAEALIVISNRDADSLKTYCNFIVSTFKRAYSLTEPNLEFIVQETNLPEYVFSNKMQLDIINAIYVSHNGVYRFIENTNSVETSSNLGIIDTNERGVQVHFLVRSSDNKIKEELQTIIQTLFEMSGAKVSLSGNYDGWLPNTNSKLVDKVANCYQDFYLRKPHIATIHAGLECGIIGSKYPSMEMVSIGPTIRYPHSPDEKVSISSVNRFYEFILRILSNID